MVKTPMKKRISRILGNLLADYLKPFIGMQVGSSFFGVSQQFQLQLWISLISALIGMGLAVSREAIDWGSEKNG